MEARPSGAAPASKPAKAQLNPGFKWDADAAEVRGPVQAPWSFAGAAAEVEQEHRARNTTSLEAKLASVIAQRVRPPSPLRAAGRGSR
jgi:hypothetical protein